MFDALEFKVTVLPAEEPKVQAALDRARVDPVRRRVYFYDTPDLALASADLFLRARITEGDDDDSTIKLRPLPATGVPARWKSTDGIRVEADVIGSREVPSVKLDHEPDRGRVEQVARGAMKPAKLFNDEQEAIIGGKLDDLVVLGPVEARKWKLPGDTLPPYELAVEEWSLPDASRFLEISFKAKPADRESAQRGFHALLDRLGIGREGDPSPKTDRVLRFFAVRL